MIIAIHLTTLDPSVVSSITFRMAVNQKATATTISLCLVDSLISSDSFFQFEDAYACGTVFHTP